MQSFDVIKEVFIPQGTILRLSEDEAERWESALQPIGPRGWFQVQGEVIFRRGDSLHFHAMPDEITQQALVPWQAWPDAQNDDPLANTEPKDPLEVLIPPSSEATDPIDLAASQPPVSSSLPTVGLSVSMKVASRQQQIWTLLVKEGRLGMQQLKAHYPQLNRRTLHRDMHYLVAQGWATVTGRQRYACYQPVLEAQASHTYNEHCPNTT